MAAKQGGAGTGIIVSYNHDRRGYDMELPDMYFTIGKSAKSETVRGLSDSKSVWSGTQYAAVCRPFLFVGKFGFQVNKLQRIAGLRGIIWYLVHLFFYVFFCR